MRFHDRLRSVLAALLGVMLGFVSLVSEATPAQGALLPTPVLLTERPCENVREAAWLVEQHRQALADRSAHLRTAEQERVERQIMLEYRAGRQRELARRNVAHDQIADLVPAQYRDMVLAVADQYETAPRIVAAVGSVESQWYAKATGTHGDSGLMQILPSTGSWIAGRLGWENYDLYDPVTNLTMGAWYLHILHREYGSWEQALAAYNGGPRAARLGADFPYTRLVLGVYHRKGA